MKEGDIIRILKINKVNTLLITIMMMAILLCCSSQVQAAQSGNYTYTVTDGKAQITKYTGAGGAVTIPSTLGGFPVTSIGNEVFANYTGLTTVTIPDGVSSIGEWAFYGCTGLRTISIPKGVTSIGKYAFAVCSGFTTISVPKGVTSIGEGAFADCRGLTSITVAVDNSEYVSISGVLFNKAETVLMACPGGLTTISIPDGVASIGTSAFNGCTGLTSITIPDSVSSIGNYTFCHCKGLTSISIPDSVLNIGYSAFVDCTGLTSIRFNSATTTIYDHVDTIPEATKIIGYIPSTAKTYATKYNRQFEVIGAVTDVSVTGVSLNKKVTTINVGANETLRATISPSNATNKDVTWDSSDPAVATVDTSGLVTAITSGETTITVSTTDGDKTDSCDVTVTEQTKTVQALSADPSTLNLSIDQQSDPIILTAIYTDGSKEDVTESATWKSIKPQFATVDDYGIVTGVANGSTTITGTYGGKTSTITVNVIPVLDSILAQPDTVSVTYGKTQTVKIYAVYTDDSKVDVTTLATLESDDPTVATVTRGTIKGICVGETSVTVTYLDQTADIPVTVTAPVTKLTADPSGLNLIIDGDPETITLTAIYKDGSDAELTGSDATWKSSKPKIATVDEDGMVTGIAKGSAMITGSYGGKSVTINVNVTPELDHFIFQPSSVGVAKGKTQAVKIYAVYADDSITDISKLIRLESDDTDVATVTGTTIKGIEVDGETTVRGTYLGQDIEILVKVTPPVKKVEEGSNTTLMNLDIGSSETLTLSATYNDGSTDEVTAYATCTSSKPNVATVEYDGESFTVTGLAKGSTTITLSFEGKKVTVKVNVTD